MAAAAFTSKQEAAAMKMKASACARVATSFRAVCQESGWDRLMSWLWCGKKAARKELEAGYG
jgi:hypothetical protein